MPTVKVYLKGWRDGRLFADAVNQDTHPLNERAMPVFDRSFRPYAPGDEVYLAVEYEGSGDDLAICDRAFERFNVGDPMDDDVVARYRGDRHRSLSVGDVVVIDGRAYTCASFGWKLIENFEPTPAAH